MIPTLLTVKHLTKIYSDGATASVKALREIDLSVSEGAIVAVMGPSGSGKTTLLNLIGTLDFPTEGSIEIDGVNPMVLHGNALADFRRKKIGFVFQSHRLIPTLTVLENVILPLLPDRHKLQFDLEDRARMLLDAVHLTNQLHRLPGQISGGECQRAAIARAIINSPVWYWETNRLGTLIPRLVKKCFRHCCPLTGNINVHFSS